MADPNILVINPGSTSTKLAVYQGETLLAESTIRHAPDAFSGCEGILAQKDIRTRCLLAFLEEAGVDPAGLDAVVGRGGLIKPVLSGTYPVNDVMLRDLYETGGGLHASSLGAVMAAQIAERYGIPAYIVDPVVVDELEPVARVCGLPGIERRSIFHALNTKAVARECAKELGLGYDQARFVVVHLGGGISVSAHRLGRVVDVNDALDGDGPFSPDRAGSVPLAPFAELCFSGRYTKEEILALVRNKGGVMAHLGTNDMLAVEERYQRGEEAAARVFLALAYQVAKEIGAMAVALESRPDGIILTGGLARSRPFVSEIRRRVEWMAPLFLRPGEEEMRALAQGALRVLAGQERAMEYPSRRGPAEAAP